MDWVIPLITALAGLGGAAVGGHYALKSQAITQRNENIRHAQKVAYETAVKEWEAARAIFFRSFDVDYTGPKANGVLPSLDDYIVHHLSLSDALDGLKLGEVGSEAIAAIFRRLSAREQKLFARGVPQQKITDDHS